MIDILAQTSHEGPTWSQFFGVLGIAAGVPSALVGWLHLRLNKLADQNAEQIAFLRREIKEGLEDNQGDHNELKKEHKADVTTLNSSTLSSVKSIYDHLGSHYIQNGELDANLEGIKASIRGVNDKLDDFLELFKVIDGRQQALMERLTRVEAKCNEKHKAAG